MGFIDSNCDGIDGDAKRAVFVSPLGVDGAAGTMAHPLRSLTAAVQLAAKRRADVYAAAGTYDEPGGLMLLSGVSVYGGYTQRWRRSASAKVFVVGGPQAILGNNVRRVTLQLLWVRSIADPAVDRSVYGIRLLDSTVTLEDVNVVAGAAVAGPAGAPALWPGESKGTPSGMVGVAGGLGGFGAVTVSGSGNRGGDGTGPGGGAGGAGGNAGGSFYPIAGSPPSAGRGADGGNGATGSPGASGASGSNSIELAGQTWIGHAGGDGGAGGTGGGGGGGGGGGAYVIPPDPTTGTGRGFVGGGLGGRGGTSGGGGPGGGGGGFGGASVGLYLWESRVTVAGCVLVAGAGGAGGAGAAGHAGASGSPGGTGLGTPLGGGGGGNGGRGGDGGAGGAGGGGAGGPSFAVFHSGGAITTFTKVKSVLRYGAGGAGGSSPGNPGQPGLATAIGGG